DTQALQKAIIECTDTSNDLDFEVEQLTESLMHVEQQKVTIQRRLQRARTLLSPIRRIPSEILAKIFSRC
ncbi:hypothetical protein M422DRAFT_147277, partial [Sphaerobolus stellatus SS14]